jgi:RNA polymerase sigma-70 factor (ECF subfamily)
VTEKEQIFSDDEVVRSVIRGRTQHFEVLVNRYKRKIVNFIHKMIYDYDEAQSLAQDTFLKVYETLDRYRSEDNFQAFIFTIARNLTLNYLKKQGRVSWLSSLTARHGETAEERYFRTESTQYEDLERSRQEELVTEALKSLKENQRIALILKVYLEFSYKEIASITGWSQSKIETLISRAKNNLIEHVRSREDAMENKKIRKKDSQEKLQEKHKSNVLSVRVT